MPYATGTVFQGTGFVNLSGVISCSSSTIELGITAMGTGGEETEIFAVSGAGCTGATLGTCSLRAIHTALLAPVHVLGSGPSGFAKATATNRPGFKKFACSTGLACGCAAPTSVPVIEESITGGVKGFFKASGPALEKIGGSASCPTSPSLAMVREVSPVGMSGGFYVRT
jgi:hypothetical protein